MAQELRRIILLHFGLVTFQFHFGKTRTVFIFMFSGPSGRDHGPQNQLFLTLETPNYSKKYEKNDNLIFDLFWGEIGDLGNRKCRKRRVPNNPEDPSDIFLKILSMGATSIKNMKW